MAPCSADCSDNDIDALMIKLPFLQNCSAWPGNGPMNYDDWTPLYTKSTLPVGLPANGYANQVAAVGTRLFFTPAKENNVGVYDIVTSTFYTNATAPISGNVKYAGSAAVGTKLIFAPDKQSNVGIFDIVSGTFTTVGNLGIYGNRKYKGATAVGDIVVFSPKGNPEENQVGLFNVTSSIFSTVEITNIEHNENNWVGSATVGTKVIFGPQLQDSVGIFDVVASTFSTIATTGDAHNVTGYVQNDQVMGFNKYNGATALGTRVYFTPSDQANVGIFDVAANVFSTVGLPGDLGVMSYWKRSKYQGGAVFGKRIFFAPAVQYNIGVFDTDTNVFTTLLSTHPTRFFTSAVTLGNMILMFRMGQSGPMVSNILSFAFFP